MALPEEELHELNIHCRFDASTNDKIHAAAALCIASGADASKIDVASPASTHVPHCTLLLGTFAVCAADVAALLEESLADCGPVRISLAAGRPTRQGKYAFWDVGGGGVAALAESVVLAAQTALRPGPEPSWLGSRPEAERDARRRQMAAHKTANSFEFYHPHVTIAYRDDADALGASLAAGPCLERVEDVIVAEIHVSPRASQGTVPRAAEASVVRLRGATPPEAVRARLASRASQ